MNLSPITPVRTVHFPRPQEPSLCRRCQHRFEGQCPGEARKTRCGSFEAIRTQAGEICPDTQEVRS